MASAVARCESVKMYRVKPYFDSSAEIISNVAMYKVKKIVDDTTGIMVSTCGAPTTLAVKGLTGKCY